MTFLESIRKRLKPPTGYSPVRLILVRLDGTESDRAALHAAAEIAAGLGAHVTGAHVPALPPTIADLQGKGKEYPGFGTSRDTISAQRAAAAEATFHAWRSDHPGSTAEAPEGRAGASFRMIDGDEPEVLSRLGRVSDLIIASRPGPATLEALLLRTGRPVLLVPNGWSGNLLAGAILLAWNGSPQAARAVGAALPLLRAAEARVTILTAPERKHPAEAGEAAEYLARHGISAEIAEAVERDAGDQLIGLARAHHVGFIVCGAFAHGPLRQAVFGGVTTTLIERAEVPVLFAG